MLYSMFKRVYEKYVVHRYEDISYIIKRTPENFPELIVEDFSFKSDENTLRGKHMYYKDYKKDKILVFCHGLRRGFNDYYPILNELARRGYYIICYNNTGCHTSDGDNIVSMTQSLHDLDNFFKYAESTNLFKDKEVMVMGHSWGGYAAGNILNYHKNISKIVVFSGFVSAVTLGKGDCVGKKKVCYKPYLEYEKIHNPAYFDSSSLDAYRNNPDKKILLIHSKDDKVVVYDENLGYLIKEGLPNNCETIIFDDRGHHPFWTLDCIKYREEEVFPKLSYVKGTRKMSYEEKLEYMDFVDYKRYYEIDKEQFDKIEEFLG